MNVTLNVPDPDGLGLAGVVPVTAVVDPVTNLKSFAIVLDGAVMKTGMPVSGQALVWSWDTTLTSDGTHVLEAVAQYKTRKSTARLVVTVDNSAPPPPPPPPALPFAEAPLRAGFKTITATQIFAALGGLSGSNIYFNLPADADYLIDLEKLKWNRALKICGNNGQNIRAINAYLDVSVPKETAPYSRSGFGFRPLSNDVALGHCSLTKAVIGGPTMADGLTYGVTGATRRGGPFTFQQLLVESRSSRDPDGVVAKPGDEPSSEHYDAFHMQGPGSPMQFGNCTFNQCSTSGTDAGKGMMLNSYLTKDEVYYLTNVNFRDDGPGASGTGAAWLKDEKTAKIILDNVWASKKGTGWTWDNRLIFYNTAVKGGPQLAYVISGAAPDRVATFPGDDGVEGEVKEGLPPGGDFWTRVLMGV